MRSTISCTTPIPTSSRMARTMTTPDLWRRKGSEARNSKPRHKVKIRVGRASRPVLRISGTRVMSLWICFLALSQAALLVSPLYQLTLSQ